MVKKKKKSRSKLRKVNTSKQEEEVRELLKSIVDENGFISRYILEGHLLYTIGCDNLQMFDVIMNLTNNKELYPIKLDDGDYYKYYPKIR